MDEITETPAFVDVSELTEEQMSEELEKGYVEVISGHIRPMKEVFNDLCIQK